MIVFYYETGIEAFVAYLNEEKDVLTSMFTILKGYMMKSK